MPTLWCRDARRETPRQLMRAVDVPRFPDRVDGHVGRRATARTELPNGSEPAIAFSQRNHVRSAAFRERRRNSWYGRSRWNERFLGSGQEFRHGQRLKEIPRSRHVEIGIRHQAPNLAGRVPFDMAIQLIVQGPQRIECRNRDRAICPSRASRLAARRSIFWPGASTCSSTSSIRTDRSHRSVANCLNAAKMNPFPPTSALLDGHAIGLDAFDMAERLERVKKQAGTATDIENSGARPCRRGRPGEFPSEGFPPERATTNAREYKSP